MSDTLTAEEIDALGEEVTMASHFDYISATLEGKLDRALAQAKRVPELEAEVARLTGELDRYRKVAELARKDCERMQWPEMEAALAAVGMKVEK